MLSVGNGTEQTLTGRRMQSSTPCQVKGDNKAPESMKPKLMTLKGKMDNSAVNCTLQLSTSGDRLNGQMHVNKERGDLSSL